MSHNRKTHALGAVAATTVTIVLVVIWGQGKAPPLSLSMPDNSQMPTNIADEVESFLSPLPLPGFYMPSQESQDSEARWITHGGTQEGFVISIREDFVVQSGRQSNSRFSNIYINFLIDNENMSIRGFDNPLRMPLAEFLNTPAVTISGEVDAAWLTVNRDEFTKTTKTDTTEQIEVVRDDSGAQATQSLTGPSKVVTYVGHDDIVLELRLGPNSMDSEYYEPHAEVLELYQTIVDSVQFVNASPASTLEAGNRSSSWQVTPFPHEQLRIGKILAAPASKTPGSEYFVDTLVVEEDTRITYVLTITNSVNNETVRLGNDSGNAVFGAQSDQYVIWSFLCDPCSDLRQGLYAYALESKNQILITEQFSPSAYPKVDGDWVVYPYVRDWAAYRVAQTAELYAHNLSNGEDHILTANVHLPRSGVIDYFAVGDNEVAWIAANLPGPLTLHVYDLSTHQTRQLKLPEPLSNPLNLAVSENVVTWWDGFWQGYDLKSDDYFSIPVIPPGWEAQNIEDFLPVTMRDGELTWALKTGGEWHYFAAPLEMSTLSTGQIP